MASCGTCSGEGFTNARCMTCLGWSDKTKCSNCGGGGMVRLACPTCHGSGQVPDRGQRR